VDGASVESCLPGAKKTVNTINDGVKETPVQSSDEQAVRMVDGNGGIAA